MMQLVVDGVSLLCRKSCPAMYVDRLCLTRRREEMLRCFGLARARISPSLGPDAATEFQLDYNMACIITRCLKVRRSATDECNDCGIICSLTLALAMPLLSCGNDNMLDQSCASQPSLRSLRRRHFAHTSPSRLILRFEASRFAAIHELHT